MPHDNNQSRTSFIALDGGAQWGEHHPAKPKVADWTSATHQCFSPSLSLYLPISLK